MNKHHEVSLSYYFIFGRIMRVLVTFLGHIVMLIMKSMHLINRHFWTYLFKDLKVVPSSMSTMEPYFLIGLVLMKNYWMRPVFVISRIIKVEAGVISRS